MIRAKVQDARQKGITELNQAFISTLLIAAAICPCFAQASENPTVVATLPADMLKSRQYIARFLSNPGRLPIGLKIDGRTVTGIPEDWKPVIRKRRIDANLVDAVFEGADPTNGIAVRVECLEYLDYPVVEWTAWFTNVGRRPTPMLSDVLALDDVFEGGSSLLWHCNGDFYSADGYAAHETPVRQGQPLAFASRGGRPSDHAFPYYRLASPGSGLSLAIGWPGQWSASFEAVAGGVRVGAGQEKTHLRLMPGESIRTPRITLMSWVGDQRRAANLWRRFYRDHVLPRPNGRPLGPRLVGHGTDDGEEFTAATEANQVRYIEKWAQRGIPIDLWWIDAGWYPCYDAKERKRRWWETGTWAPDAERFPHGLKPVSDSAARHGADLLIWFEPERVRPGSQLDRRSPIGC